MNKSMLLLALVATMGLAACDRPAVVTVPATPVAVPGPAGPAGPTGATGNTGNQGAEGAPGATGQSGDGTTIVVMPPASAPSN
jgi:hypothetical protein